MINVSVHNIKKAKLTRLSDTSCVINLEGSTGDETSLFLGDIKAAQKLFNAAQRAVYFFKTRGKN